MAVSAVGLKTYQWNNNIKSLLFLLLYPIVFTATYLSLLAVVLVYVKIDYHKKYDVAEMLQTIAVDYWYAPYAFLFVFLTVVYLYNRHRMDVAVDMKPITRESHPKLYDFLENLCISRGLPTPYFFMQRHESCNAYTTGLSPDTYRIVVTTGLLQALNDEELETVLAHELTHLINGDTRLVFLTGTVSRMFTTLARWVTPSNSSNSEFEDDAIFPQRNARAQDLILGAVLGAIFKLGGLGAFFAQLFISRKREYIADAGAVELTKNPQALISALKKVEGQTFGFNHCDAIKPSLLNYTNFGMLRTHPSIPDRIAAIRFYSRLEPKLSPWSRKALRQIKNAPPSEEEVIW